MVINIILLCIVIVIIITTILLYIYLGGNKNENFSNVEETLQNIASLYNSSNFTVSNMTVTGTFNLLPKTSVFDNVKLPLLYSQLKDHNKRVEEAIKAVGLWHRAHNLSNQLSGGERQRVAIARALVTNPTVIFADEPTGNLDHKSGQVIMGILEKLNNDGHTIILVTHEQYTAQHAQRIIKLIDGQIVSDERVSERRSSLNGNNFLK